MGFSLKSVKKAVSNVAKVAVAPIVTTAASSLNAVGLRNAANTVVKKTEGTGKLGKTISKASTVGGWAIDAGALAVGAAAAAPAIGSAASSVGGAVATGAKVAGGVIAKYGSTAAALLKKGAAKSSDVASASESPSAGNTVSDLVNSIGKKSRTALLNAVNKAGQGRGFSLTPSNSETLPDTSVAAASVGGGMTGWLPLIAIGGILLLGFFGRRGK